MEDWKKCKLSELCIEGKGSYGIAASAVAYSEDLYTYLRITDINDDGTFTIKISAMGYDSNDNEKGISTYYLGSTDEIIKGKKDYFLVVAE